MTASVVSSGGMPNSLYYKYATALWLSATVKHRITFELSCCLMIAPNKIGLYWLWVKRRSGRALHSKLTSVQPYSVTLSQRPYLPGHVSRT